MAETQEDVELALAAQQEGIGSAASPNPAYIRYIMEDDFKPDRLPPELQAVVYDKEMALSNLRDNEIMWCRLALQRAEIMFRMSRPALAGTHKEEILLASLQPKMLIKLSRSRDGGFERKQQTTQTIIRQAVVSGGGVPQKRRWSIFGRHREEVPR